MSLYTYAINTFCCVCFSPCFLSSSFFVKFGELGGFTAIQTKLNTDEIEIAVRLSYICLPCPPHIWPDVS